MANDIITICEENNLSYHLTGGTALGAVRHHGFIPWDDDLDIDIERKDYNKLLEIIKEKYQDKYFIHNPYNKDGFSTVATNIRMKNTIVPVAPTAASASDPTPFPTIIVSTIL